MEKTLEQIQVEKKELLGKVYKLLREFNESNPGLIVKSVNMVDLMTMDATRIGRDYTYDLTIELK
jgi:hypothetical protein